VEIQNVSKKHLIELEQSVRHLLDMLKKTKLHQEPIVESLKALEQELGEARRQSFDAKNSEYHTY